MLQQLGVSFKTITIEADEPSFDRMAARRINIQKAVDFVSNVVEWKLAQALQSSSQETRLPIPILAADTLIFHHGRVLEKPKDRDEAFVMLNALQGGAHHAISVVAMAQNDKQSSRLSLTEVTFAPLSTVQINAYLDTGEYVGKAGAYAVQGYAAAFISMLKGSYSGVMGLPLEQTAELLNDFGIEYWNLP